MFCEKCGKEIIKVMAFCPQCGNKLQQDSGNEKAHFIENTKIQEEEQLKEKKKATVSTPIYKKIALGVGILFGIIIAGAGVLKIAGLRGMEEIKINNQAKITSKNSNNNAKENAKKQENWDLFQSKESAFILTEEEKVWTTTQLDEFYKAMNQTEWEEKLFSFKVLERAERQDDTILIDAVCCIHPIFLKQYVIQVQYVKLQFSTKQEPELEDIQFAVADSEENKFTTAKASSVCGSQRNNVSQNKERCYYDAENVVDNDETTAWIEGDKKGYGKGEWISLSGSKSQKICGIAIRNGFTKSDRTMERNAQVKKVTITCSDGSSQVYELQKNTYATGVDEWYSDCVLFDEPIDTKKVTLTIESVYQGKRFYEYWNKGEKYYEQSSDKCKDTCISEIKVLTMPEDDLYETEEIEKLQEETERYDSWQQAYQDALEQPQKVMERYNENMKLYVNEYKPSPISHIRVEKRYDENGMLYLPNSGFLEDINGDSVPELFLIHANEKEYGNGNDVKGNFSECVAHVFTFDTKNNCLLYSGSFTTRFNDEEAGTSFYKDQRDNSLRAYLWYGQGEMEGTDYYSYFGLKENKLAWNKVLEFGQTMKEDYSVAMVRWWKKDHLSITKEEFEQEEKNDEKYLTRVELLTLEEVEECLQ